MKIIDLLNIKYPFANIVITQIGSSLKPSPSPFAKSKDVSSTLHNDDDNNAIFSSKACESINELSAHAHCDKNHNVIWNEIMW